MRRRSPLFVLACLVAIAAAIGLGIGAGALSRVSSPSGAAPPSGVTTEASPPLASPPATPTAAATGSPEASGSPSASASATARPPGSAPLTARGFRLRSTIVAIGFPLPVNAKPHYGPAWHAPRVGAPLPYQSVRGLDKKGRLLRAHDGIDIQVRIGTPVLAAFSGVVVDPATKWRPWAPNLYGYVVVIRSTEPTSPGYYAINAHLSRVGVAIGQAVMRGQVIGLTGISGDAAGTIPHLHFELRAPFFIDQTWGGIVRRLDVFDPLPSLRAAAPRVR